MSKLEFHTIELQLSHEQNPLLIVLRNKGGDTFTSKNEDLSDFLFGAKYVDNPFPSNAPSAWVYYELVPASEKPDKDGRYFIINDFGYQDVATFLENGGWMNYDTDVEGGWYYVEVKSWLRPVPFPSRGNSEDVLDARLWDQLQKNLQEIVDLHEDRSLVMFNVEASLDIVRALRTK